MDNDLNPPRIGTTMRWIFWIGMVGLVGGLLFAYVNGALDWLIKPIDLTSPARLQALSQEANEEWQSLDAQKASIAAVSQKMQDMIDTYSDDRSTWPQGKADEYLQLSAQRTNLIMAYNASCGQSRAMWQDEWKALGAPADLPTTCEFMS